LRGEDQEWRPFIHGEHSPCYRQEQANHYLTDGKEKFVWLTHEGHEQLFDLVNDPDECRNLAAEPDSEGRVSIWRNRLMERLKNRPEGFTDGKQLVAGRPYSAALPHAL
jgi:hypothetical protein